MGLSSLQKHTVELLRQTFTLSPTRERIATFVLVAVFRSTVGSPRGSLVVAGPGMVFPDTRVFMTESTLTFLEGMRLRFEGRDWDIIDVIPAKSLFACGRKLFTRIKCREVLSGGQGQ